MSKGSKQRPMNKNQFNKGFDQIFNKENVSVSTEWICYTNAINNIRHSYGLDSKVFTENDKKRFNTAHKAKYK
tara:strand:- start:400 stop:618 length:219 start_codon:yes stop_codon:yes gene_type:complete